MQPTNQALILQIKMFFSQTELKSETVTTL